MMPSVRACIPDQLTSISSTHISIRQTVNPVAQVQRITLKCRVVMELYPVEIESVAGRNMQIPGNLRNVYFSLDETSFAGD
mmetsp:Transcript_37459/g.149450  ORF Transcript_37459/g.149450 Transcript_37459/m.149450 type:complete len:81 (+) Transcript_37459:700-942(+)